MDTNTEQQQLFFDKGLTTNPSDAICSDNTLAQSVGLVYDNGEHRPVQAPVTCITGATRILYVHRFGDQSRYITLNYKNINWGTIQEGSNSFVYAHDDDGQHTSLHAVKGTPTVTSVGKTLIIADDTGIHYALWKENTYKCFDTIPAPSILFRLAEGRWSAESKGDATNIIGQANSGYVVTESNQEKYNNLVLGLYAKNKLDIQRQKRFTSPFLIRAALKLYDGSYHYVTNPVMLLPTMQHNSEARIYNNDTAFQQAVNLSTFSAQLEYKQLTDYTDFSDIVKGVTLFISRPVDTVDTTEDQPQPSVAGSILGYYKLSPVDRPAYQVRNFDAGYYKVLRLRSTADLNKELAETSVFYRLCDITGKVTTWHNAALLFDDHTLENITTQQQLPQDDYFSRSLLQPAFIKAYNSRLNIASVRRTFFEGYANFMPNDAPNLSSYHFYVQIETDQGNVTVHRTNTSAELQGIYFNYPDARARHVWIYRDGTPGNNGTCILSEDLTEHPGLNAAYYFRGLPLYEYTETAVTPTSTPSTTEDETPSELLPNYIITSEVNNPFVFRAEGYNKVGTGRIIGMATTTMALSNDAFGRTDLIVFSDTGIWGMTVGTTGLFTSIHPFSREVCSRPETITETDGAVFFLSDKGLMRATADGVQCVSEHLHSVRGDSSLRLSETNFIAYDYRDSLLWLFNGTAECLLYSLRHGTFATYRFAEPVTSVVNNYPDYLLQSRQTVCTLLGRPHEADDPLHYEATLVSRPLKLQNALALKTIMQLRHILVVNPEASIHFSIEASNDLRYWYTLTSLRGIPWKYYRFTYHFQNLQATDRFSGTVLVTQERRTNRLR